MTSCLFLKSGGKQSLWKLIVKSKTRQRCLGKIFFTLSHALSLSVFLSCFLSFSIFLSAHFLSVSPLFGFFKQDLFVLLDLIGGPMPRFGNQFSNTARWLSRLQNIGKPFSSYLKALVLLSSSSPPIWQWVLHSEADGMDQGGKS